MNIDDRGARPPSWPAHTLPHHEPSTRRGQRPLAGVLERRGLRGLARQCLSSAARVLRRPPAPVPRSLRRPTQPASITDEATGPGARGPAPSFGLPGAGRQARTWARASMTVRRATPSLPPSGRRCTRSTHPSQQASRWRVVQGLTFPGRVAEANYESSRCGSARTKPSLDVDRAALPAADQRRSHNRELAREKPRHQPARSRFTATACPGARPRSRRGQLRPRRWSLRCQTGALALRPRGAAQSQAPRLPEPRRLAMLLPPRPTARAGS